MSKKKQCSSTVNKSRRSFLQKSSVVLGSTLIASPALASSKTCHPTSQDIVGPFYRFGAPFKAKLAGPDEPGERIILKGTVYAADCKTPLPGALIEFWQANSKGEYDINKPGNFTDTSTFNLRTKLYTNEKGQYEIETIMPGRYSIPPNLPGLEEFAGETRPAHIHFKVTESLHIPLTSQMYFKGDPYIAHDPWAREKPDMAIDLQKDGELSRGVFDIVLAQGL